MQVHRQSADDALLALRSCQAGLGEAEAAARLREFGPNVIEPAEKGRGNAPVPAIEIA